MRLSLENRALPVIPNETSDGASSHEPFPDEKAPETVCFGYVFYKLGLDPKIVQSGLYDETLQQYFEEVLSVDEADAIAFIGRDGIEHIVYVSPDSTLHHRDGSHPPTAISIEQLKKEYMEDPSEQVKCRMILLKLKN